MTTPPQDPQANTTQHNLEKQHEHDLDQSWAEFLETRAWVREVVSDDDLRSFGFNLDVLDRKPQTDDFPQAGEFA